MLKDFLDAVLNPEVGITGEPVDQDVPPPLIMGNYEYGSMMDFCRADDSEGFILLSEKPDPMINWRYEAAHLYVDSPDAWLIFTVDGQGAGLLPLCGPDTGIFEYSIEGSQFFASTCSTIGVWVRFARCWPFCPIQEDRGTHRVTVRNTGEKDPRSTGTYLRILKLLSN